MSNPAPTPLKSKPKRSRRNFAAELRDLKTYCEVNVEVLQSVGLTSENVTKIEVFTAIIKRLEK